MRGIMKYITDKITEVLTIHKTGLELLKIAHKMDSAIIPLQIIHAVIQVADIYLGLFFTAELIDSLLAGAFSRAFLYAGLVILEMLCLGVAGLLLEGLFKKSSDRLRIGFYIMIREKVLSLDYETMEQPDVANRIAHSERTVQMHGGLANIVKVYRNLLGSLLTIAMSVGLAVTLCFAGSKVENGVLGMAARPAVSIALMTAVSAITFVIYVKGSKRFLQKNEEIFRNHTDVELKGTYMFDSLLIDYKAGKVIRIYDMKDMLLSNFRKFNAQSTEYFGRWNDVLNQENLFRNCL